MLMRRCLVVLATAGLLLATALPAPSASISEVKSAGNWMQVTVEGIVTYVEPVECYIQSRDRSSGIRVIGPTDGLNVGDSVLANGTFAVVDGEPTVTGASIIPQGTPSAISPFGMTNRDIGGASKWSPLSIWDYTSRRFVSGDWVREWTRACGANNTGLLVSTWGTVRSLYSSPVTGARWMYVDDGSGVVSDLGDTGLLVYSKADVNRGDFVRVTGVSSTEPSIEHPGRLVRVIRTRSSEDVQVERAAQLPDPEDYLFSDEFDGPELDPRWFALSGMQYVTLDASPGWLTLAPAVVVRTDPQPPPPPLPSIGHYALEDWDLDMRVRIEMPDGPVTAPCQFRADFLSSYYLVQIDVAAGGSMSARVCWQTVGTLPGDTCYFRVRKRGTEVTASASFDGVSYTGECLRSYSYSELYMLSLTASAHNTTGEPRRFLVHIDYFRMTRVGGAGGTQ